MRVRGITRVLRTRDKPACLTASAWEQPSTPIEAERRVNGSCEKLGKTYSRYNKQKRSTHLPFRSQICKSSQCGIDRVFLALAVCVNKKVRKQASFLL